MKTSFNRSWKFLLVLGSFAAVGGLDYFTGYQVRLGALYAIPVGLAVWFFNAPMGVVFAVSSTVFAYWSERVTGEVYPAMWIPVVNGISRLALLLFVAFSIRYFKRTIALAHKRTEAFAGRLPICACCHRVDGGNGFWMDFPTYLRKNSEAEPEFRTCPICTAANVAGPAANSQKK